MTIKKDYAQSQYKIAIDEEDENIQVWWMAKNLDGEVYPVELQMSLRGANNLRRDLSDAIFKLQDLIERKPENNPKLKD